MLPWSVTIKLLHILIALFSVCFSFLLLLAFLFNRYTHIVSVVVWKLLSFLNDVKIGNIWHKLKRYAGLWLSLKTLLFVYLRKVACSNVLIIALNDQNIHALMFWLALINSLSYILKLWSTYFECYTMKLELIETVIIHW